MSGATVSGVAGQRVAVLGLGVAGEACARALLDAGAEVLIVDANDGERQRARAATLDGATVSLGDDAPDLGGYDIAVLSPGIAPGSPLWKAAHEAKEAIGEIELAYRLGVRPIAAITGTNGKTTVTEMLTACLREDGRDAHAAGNIGAPLIAALGDAIVAEVSSFQCATLASFRVPVAVLTNIAEDHLDWHGSYASYRAAKVRLLEAAEHIVLHASCVDLRDGFGVPSLVYDAASPDADGAGVLDGTLVVGSRAIIDVRDLPSSLPPFVEDAVAAAAAAVVLGVSPGAIARALRSTAPGAHRLQDVGRVGGVRFIDDSKATDPHATLAAVAAFPGSVLIAGGLNKGLDLRALRVAAPALRGVIALGDAAAEVLDAFASTDVPTEEADSMQDAVARAYARARPDGTVLLSPACASFDMFTSYAARGDAFVAAFRSIVEAL